MLKFLILIALAAFAVADEFDDIDEDMIRTFKGKLEETEKELRMLENISLGGKVGTRSGLREKIKQKVKEMCSCSSNKECQCCVQKEIKIAKLNWSFAPKACFTFAVEPSTKMINLKINFGDLNVFEKEASFESIEQKCKKVEKFKNLEFCYYMQVVENEQKGLSACLKLHANIMEIFNQPIFLPCVNFKDSKLSIDEDFEGYEEGGIKLNLKAIWKKFKDLVGLGKKKE